MNVLRVFVKRTTLTPDDPMVRIGGPGLFDGDYDEIHVSALFTWQRKAAELLAGAWKYNGPVKVGGPGFGERGEAHVPGLYTRHGAVITSRGCPNRCWFCKVPQREGAVREYAINDGYNVLDDNLLRCSRPHIEAVFAMLKRQPQRPKFTGGLEAAALERWHVEALRDLKPEALYFAYDTPDDLEPLQDAAALLREVWPVAMTSHRAHCYVLCGWKRDTFEAAQARCETVARMGIMPFAMAWQDDDGGKLPGWSAFQRRWANAIEVGMRMRELRGGDAAPGGRG